MQTISLPLQKWESNYPCFGRPSYFTVLRHRKNHFKTTGSCPVTELAEKMFLKGNWVPFRKLGKLGAQHDWGKPVVIPFYSHVKSGKVYGKIKTCIWSVSDQSFWGCKLNVVWMSLEVFAKIPSSRQVYECYLQVSWHRSEGSYSE